MLALPPLDPGFEMALSSRGMSKGIEQSDEPQVIPKLFVQIGDLQAGAQWKNVTSTVAEGEAAAFLNAARKLGPIQLTVGAAYKFQTGAPRGADSDSLEFSSTAIHKAGKLSLRVAAVFSPDDLGATKRSLYVEGGPSLDVTKTLRISASLGHRTREGSPDYTAMNLGATKTLFRGLALDVRYYQTNRNNLGDIYRRRLIVSGRWSF